MDWEGEISKGEEEMARGLENLVEPCSQCGFNEEPNLKEESRVSYREVGKQGDYAYSRSVSLRQVVLVCLSCGEVHKVISELK